MFSQHFLLLLLLLVVCFTTFLDVGGLSGTTHANYRDALQKSIVFLQGQRSGKLNASEQLNITWRGDSALNDGQQAGVNLTGGYYDAGDNLKFNFPMAFTTTMLSWAAMESAGKMGPTDLESTREAIRWSTDYLLKCASKVKSEKKLFVGVGEPNQDHSCWERPEDMDTDRTVYSVTVGSDVAGETAAALASASIVFRRNDYNYSKKLLATAKRVMQFAIDNRGPYSDQLPQNMRNFYYSYSGYQDELVWGAAWMLRATNDYSYLNFINSLGGLGDSDIFSWDNKFAGAWVLLSRGYLLGKKEESFHQFSQQADNFMCKILPDSPWSSSTFYTRGGLMYKIDGSNLQYVTVITFLLTAYSNYMSASKHTFTCGNLIVTQKTLRILARKQVDYILGQNPKNMSYMVGYGMIYPQRIHHRGSSLPSISVHPEQIKCGDGFQYMSSPNPDPNILTGAIVGGPDRNDDYADDPNNYGQSEPTTYINAAIVGPLAYFAPRPLPPPAAAAAAAGGN